MQASVSPLPDSSFSSSPFCLQGSFLVDPAADVALPPVLWSVEPCEPVGERQMDVWHTGAGRAAELPSLAALPAPPRVPDLRSSPGEHAVFAEVPRNTELLLKY